MSGDDRRLRVLLAETLAAQHGWRLYRDDGECSCACVHPSIDFLRDSPDQIDRSLKMRALLRAAGGVASEPGGGAHALVQRAHRAEERLADLERWGGEIDRQLAQAPLHTHAQRATASQWEPLV